MDVHSGFSPGDPDSGAADPFSRFWIDWMSKMAGAGFAQPSTSGSDQVMKQMRQAFFDSWASHCDEFMRSETFLQAMKKGMDNALAFKQQLNEFLTRSLHEGQIPARSDTDSILLVLRSMEDRVLSQIAQLSQRVADLEKRTGVSSPTTSSAAASSEKRHPAKGAAR